MSTGRGSSMKTSSEYCLVHGVLFSFCPCWCCPCCFSGMAWLCLMCSLFSFPHHKMRHWWSVISSIMQTGKVWKSKNKICSQTSVCFFLKILLNCLIVFMRLCQTPADHFHFQIDVPKDSAKAESLIEGNDILTWGAFWRQPAHLCIDFGKSFFSMCATRSAPAWSLRPFDRKVFRMDVSKPGNSLDCWIKTSLLRDDSDTDSSQDHRDL